MRAAVAQQRREAAKAAQARSGYTDENGIRQGGLIAFIRYFWRILEPETKFVDGWALWAICEHLEAVTRGEIHRLLINVPPGFCKSLTVDVFWPAWEWGPRNLAHLRYVAFSYTGSLTFRDNVRFRDLITCPQFVELWGDRVVLSKKGEEKVLTEKKGWKLASSVGGVGTGERADRVILDDPHNVKEAESETVRTETVRWFREAMSNRLNDMDRGVIVIIMQRVHEDDVSGAILSLGFDYVHLMIPLEYDCDRQTDENGDPLQTAIGWSDPRHSEDPDQCDGALAWPERFPPHVVTRIKSEVGPYAWCTPGESPVLMADLSLRPIAEVAVGDNVVGFATGTPTKRARLKPSRVLAVSKSIQPVVRITLDSGATARCTADHKWFTGRTTVGRKTYAPAQVGTPLKRVCPARLPEIASSDDARLAGWIGGFFDGEGSITVMHRRSGEGASLITFAQSAEQNLSLCEKLEGGLSHFGFNWGCSEWMPTTLSSAGVPWQKRRIYYLKSDAGKGRTKNGPALRGSRLAVYQRFLHLIQPTKWRDRLINTTINGRMYTTTEHVVSIEPDGVETVYGLTTETGNYVVWGLASSNSGQYQQAPSPRGGGIFKREWWQLWEAADGNFPVVEYVIASLDGAFTEKEEANPSGLTVWGTFRDAENRRRIMLLHAWRKHLAFSGPRIAFEPGETVAAHRRRTMEHWGLIEWCADTCNRFKVDKLLIEAKGPGISAAHELRSRYGLQDWAIELAPVKGDKVARALAAQPTFSQLMVFAPARDWAEMVIEEAAVFPKGKYDDLTDSMTQAINHLRDVGLAQTEEERRAEEDDQARHRPKPKPLYPV